MLLTPKGMKFPTIKEMMAYIKDNHLKDGTYEADIDNLLLITSPTDDDPKEMDASTDVDGFGSSDFPFFWGPQMYYPYTLPFVM